jgi:hypothetical protein
MFENEIARYFVKNVGNEEDEEGDVILVAFHVQVFLKPLDSLHCRC